MYLSLPIALLAGAPFVVGQSAKEPAESTIQPTQTAIAATAATQAALSPVSNVQGVAFNKFYQIWLENTDYSASSGDPNLQKLAKLGISLTNYFAVTHPSEPNYMAAVAGDYFGCENDDFHLVPSNVSTIVDMLDTKGISWAEYQEGLPYAGYQGFNFSNQQTFANNYVRKHNPLVLFDSIASNATKLSQIKNFTSLQSDVKANTLPQWAFITPNMTNDAHDTNVTFSAQWEANFLSTLLNDTNFMNGTLLLLTFDEDETYTEHNTVFSILIGGPGVIPDNLKGTSDNTFYNHYSTISTVAVNWGLPQLGRWDCNANVFALVANKTGYNNVKVDTTNLYFNQSSPGPLSDTAYINSWPAPNANATCASGKGVLDIVKKTWGTIKPTNNYTVAGTPAGNSSGTGAAPASTTSKTGNATSYGVSILVLVLATGLAVLLL